MEAAQRFAEPPSGGGDGGSAQATDLCVVLDVEQMQRLRAVFDAAGPEGFDQAQFAEAVTGLLPKGTMGSLDLRMLFMRIDVLGAGRVVWSDVVTFLLVSRTRNATTVEEAKDHYQEQVPFATSDFPHAAHLQPITRVVCHPRLKRYYSCAEDGMVKMWNAATLSYEHTIHCTSAWVSSMLYVPSSPELLAVATVDNVLSLYDPDSGDALRLFRGAKRGQRRDGRDELVYRRRIPRPQQHHCRLVGVDEGESDSTLLAHLEKRDAHEVSTLEGLHAVPTSLGYLNAGDSEGLLVGTDDGNILLYDVVHELGKPSGYAPCLSLWKTGHQGAITALHTAPSIESIITSGVDTTLRLASMERGSVLRTLGVDEQGQDVGHRKAVYSVAWSDEHRTIASCGAERDILLWNPFITKPLTRLTGSRSPLVDVVFNDSDAQLISLSTDSTVCIWDIRMWQCIKVLKNKEDPLSALAFDKNRRRIIVGSSKLFTRSMLKQRSLFPPRYRGHRSAVVAAVVTAKHRQILSADASNVMVWDMATGNQLVQWAIPSGVASMCLDASEACVVTGTNAGEVLVWNYVSAQLLKSLSCRKKSESAAGGGTAGSTGSGSRRAGDVSPVLYAVTDKPYKLHLIASVFCGKRLVLFDDRDEKLETCFRDVDLRELNGAYSLGFIPPFTVVLGTGVGVAVLHMDQVTRPSLLPALAEPCVYFGVHDGPLHEGACDGGPGDAGAQGSTPSEWKAVDSYVETLVPLSRLSNLVVACSGEGCVSFWACPSEQTPGAVVGELFRFGGTYKQGNPLHVAVVDPTETLLLTGDVDGYVRVYDIARLTAAPDHTQIVKLRHFRAFEASVSSLVCVDEAGCGGGTTAAAAAAVLCGSADHHLSLFSLDGVALRQFGLADAAPHEPLPDSSSAKVCLARYRRAHVAKVLGAAHGPVTLPHLLTMVQAGGAFPGLFDRFGEEGMTALLEEMAAEATPAVRLEFGAEHVVVTLRDADAVAASASSAAAATAAAAAAADEGADGEAVSPAQGTGLPTVDFSLVSQKKEGGSQADALGQQICHTTTVRVLPDRPLGHICSHDVYQKADLDARQPMCASADRARGRRRFVKGGGQPRLQQSADAEAQSVVGEAADAATTAAAPAAAPAYPTPPCITTFQSNLLEPPPQMLAAQKALLCIAPAPPKHRRDAKEASSAAAAADGGSRAASGGASGKRKGAKYAYPEVLDAPQRRLRKTPLTWVHQEGRTRGRTAPPAQAPRAPKTARARFDLMGGVWAGEGDAQRRASAAACDDWVLRGPPEEEPRPLSFWDSEAELPQRARRTPQVVASDACAVRRHGLVDGGRSGSAQESRGSSRGGDSRPQSTDSSGGFADLACSVFRSSDAGGGTFSEVAALAQSVRHTAALSSDATQAAAEMKQERQWFERAQQEYPPTKRRHMKYDVSSVPLRAHMHMTVPEPVPIKTPKRSHTKTLGSNGVGSEVEAILEKAACLSVPVWVNKRPSLGRSAV